MYQENDDEKFKALDKEGMDWLFKTIEHRGEMRTLEILGFLQYLLYEKLHQDYERIKKEMEIKH